MAEEQAPLREVQWRQVCPWLVLFRAFGIAMDLKKLLLGALGVLAMSAGWSALAGIFNYAAKDTVAQQVAEVQHWPWESDQWPAHKVSGNERSRELLIELENAQVSLTEADQRTMESRFGAKRGVAILDEFVESPLGTLGQLARNWRFVLRPVIELKRPFQHIFEHGFGFVPAVFALACGLWAVVVWAIFGGAITRIAAVQFARDEKIGLMDALRFSTSKFLSYAGAPVIPLFFVAFFTLLCMAGGFISWLFALVGLPGLGAIFSGSLWVLPLLAGFAMTMILLLWSIGWPLMLSTISAEGSDSFDALSRSYAYAFQRPWHYLFYAVAATIYGSLCSFVVLLFADVVVHVSHWAVSWGGGKSLQSLLDQMFYYAPEASGWSTTLSADNVPTGARKLGAIFTGGWLYVVFMLLVGFVYSYFWSASTIIYFLLRRDVDNTEIQEVFLEGAEDDFEMPASGPASPVVTPAGPPAAGA